MIERLVRAVTSVFCAAVMGFSSGAASLSAQAFNFTPVKGIDSENRFIKLDLYSDSAYMINMDTGDVIIDVKSDKQRVPASLTKIMTAVVLLDEFNGDKQKMELTRYSAPPEYFDGLWDMGASLADIRAYEEVNCYDLLAALMIPSGCDAANVIAYGMCGSTDKFCERMNAKAAELGMNDSHFSNVHGLSGDNNYTTCRDLAKLCTYALDNYDIFREIVAMNSYVMSPTDYHPEGTYITNTNYMLSIDSGGYFYPYCLGIKTGTLDVAGRCLASYAVNDGNRYMIVTMGAPLEKQEKDYQKGFDDPESVFAADTVYYNFVDHINLYNWAFRYISGRDLVSAGSEIREARVEYGEGGRDYVNLVPQHGCRVTFPVYIEDKDIDREIEVYDNVVAPVYKGDVLGRMKLSFEGEQIADIPLIAADSVARSRKESVTAVVKSFPRSKPFRITLAVCITGIILYTVLYAVWVQKHYMKK